MKHIPLTLIYSRIAAGFTAIILSVFNVPGYSNIAIILLIFGLVSDFFDGVMARYLNVSTQRIRRLDSTADVIFFICIAIATYIQCPSFFKDNIAWLVILTGAEILTYIVCFFKFKKEIAFHSLGAKLWALTLFLTLGEVMFHCDSKLMLQICFWIGMVTRLEIIAIVLLLKDWTNDVPTWYHALRLRQGKDINRNKLFNG